MKHSLTEKTTKEKILDVAVDLFSEYGYTETSIRAIAKKVGIKESSIYNHYSCKQDIFDAILREYKQLVERNNTLSIPRKKEEEFIKNLNTEKILNTLFLYFPKDQYIRYRKILRIIWQEQFRNERAHEYILDILYKKNETLLQDFLQMLLKYDKIKKVDPTFYAKLINSVIIAYSIENSHGVIDTAPNFKGWKMEDILRSLVDQLFDAEHIPAT